MEAMEEEVEEDEIEETHRTSRQKTFKVVEAKYEAKT